MVNKTFRLFISSTFNDFLEERRILNKDVFNVIDAFCRSKGYFFQLIDLRWGINNESAINQNTMAICLDEVKRCKKLSPKPNFLIMIGERYGWIPLPSKIQSADFEKIIEICGKPERALLEEWYLYDGNEIGGEYYLKPRSGIFVDDDIWAETEKNLGKELLFCAKKSGFSEEKIKDITSSATEKEIVEGLLGNKEVCDNSIAFFRNGYSNKDENDESIQALRNKILSRMQQDGCADNIIELEYSESEEYLKTFRKIIIKKIKQNILEEINRLEEENKTKIDSDFLEESTTDSGFFYARENELNTIVNYVKGDKATPLFIAGESGSGKTAILTEFIKRETKKQNNIVFGFFGFDDNSYTLLDILQKICFKIKNDFEIANSLELCENNMAEAFCHMINSVPDYEKVTIVIDGLDMFFDIASIRESVFPSKLPENVKLIISAADKNVVENFIDPSFEIVKIEHFNKKESHEMLNILLKSRNRQIASECQQKIIDDAIGNGTTPIHMKLISEICCLWHSGDTDISLGDSPESTVLQFIKNMYLKFGHDESVVLYSMALISASPYGITEDELVTLLFQFDEVKKHFVKEDRYSHNLEKMPFVIWSRLFYDLKGCFELTRSHYSIVVAFSHNIFKRVFNDAYGLLCADAKEKMIEYFSEQQNYEGEEKYPNRRKALMLPELLRNCNKVDELGELYLDLNFVNACILNGNVNEPILNLQYVLDNQEVSVTNNRLFKIFTCIQKNRETLKYYRNSFFDFANEAGICELGTKLVFQRISENASVEDFLPFPYAYDAKVAWYSDGKRYAVYLNSYVYICSLPTCMELCRIYIDVADDLSESVVQQVIWMDENALAIKTEKNRLIVYDFEDMIPNKIAEYECSYPSVKYDCKNKNLLFIHKYMLYAINPFTNEKVFTIKLKKKRIYTTESFDYIAETNQIALKNKYDEIFTYDSNNGNPVDVVAIGQISLTGRTLGQVLQIFENKWLIHNNDVFSIYDKTTEKEHFLMLPLNSEMEQVLIGRQNLVVFDDRLLLAINLENYEIKHYKIDGVLSVEWRIPEKEISVITPDGLGFIKISDFKAFAEPMYCMTSKRERLKNKNTKKELNEIGYLFRGIINYFEGGVGYKKYDYDAVLFPINGTEKLTKKIAERASIIEYANDGKRVIVYEGINTLTVRDSDDNLLLQIDKLGLSMVNGILGLQFSPNSKFLVVWRHLSVQVFDISKGKCTTEIDLSFVPAIKVGFSDDSTIYLILSDDEFYEYDICKNNIGKKLPKKIIEKRLSEVHIGAYTYCIDAEGSFPISILDNYNFEKPPRKWLNNQRLYYSDDWQDGIYYDDGDFFLLYGAEGALSHSFFDFDGVLNAERIKDSTYLSCFLREKNDIFSSLYNHMDERYLILVSRMLNSVILFDKTEHKVLAAYKHSTNIIGERLVNNNVIEIISNQKPYRTLLEVNLPE